MGNATWERCCAPRFLLAALVLRLFGWRVVGPFPPVAKAVLVVAPHTSNWDFIVGVLAKWVLDLDVTFIGKHTLFRGPFGWWLRRLGGIPVDRDRPGDIVAQVGARMRAADRMLFAIAPEGTRRRASGWKTGFHRIALDAGVPVVPVLIDGARREVRIAPPLAMTGDVAADFAALAAVFAGASGINPVNASPVQAERVGPPGGVGHHN